jgi:hypothetical protein
MKNSSKNNYDSIFEEEKSGGNEKIIINDSKENKFKGVKNQEKTAHSTTIPDNGGEKGNIIDKVKGMFKFNNSNSTLTETTNNNSTSENPQEMSCKDKLMKKLQDNIEIEKSYKTFFILISIGLGLLCLSLMFLPFIILSPHKFIMCFSFGSLIILSSFIFVYGTKSYFEILFSQNRFLFTILFLASIFLGVFLSLAGYFIFSVLCAISQLITLIVFTLSFVPGGSGGISLIGRMLTSPFAGIIMRIRGESHLPS